MNRKYDKYHVFRFILKASLFSAKSNYSLFKRTNF